jgi:chemotaxis protein methyltransferase CheR
MTEIDFGRSTNDIPFSDADFSALAALARAEFGLNLAESKKPLVYSRLSRRLKARNINGFPEYMALLERQGEAAERLQLISALTTNVTSFFRENHHFETLKKEALDHLLPMAAKGGRLRIWSAGCSSGQEPYSIAMSILADLPDAGRHDVRILATDIDPQIVQKAKAGTYPMEELEGVPSAFQTKWVQSAAGDPKSVTMSDDLKSLVTFAELNLIADWPMRGPFDAIFCRNVAIYFDQETQQTLWQRFCDLLTPGGLLFIGHSERITGPATRKLNGIGITSYSKSADAVTSQ